MSKKVKFWIEIYINNVLDNFWYIELEFFLFYDKNLLIILRMWFVFIIKI